MDNDLISKNNDDEVSFTYFIHNILFKDSIKIKEIPSNIHELSLKVISVVDEIQYLEVGGTLSSEAQDFLVAMSKKTF